MQFGVGVSGPRAEIEFVELSQCNRRDSQAKRKRVRGFRRAPLRAGINRRDWLRTELERQLRRLCAAFAIERITGSAPGDALTETVDGSVANE